MGESLPESGEYMKPRLKTFILQSLIILIVIAIAALAEAKEEKSEEIATVVGMFSGMQIAKKGEHYLFDEWESQELRVDFFEIYNVETKKKKKFKPNRKGYFLMEIPAGKYQVRNKKTRLEARKTKQKYDVFSQFEIQGSLIINLGIFNIISSDSKLSGDQIKATYAIVHREDRQSYQPPLDWLRMKKPELMENEAENIICPFPHAPGNALNERSAEPSDFMTELFGVTPGCTVDYLEKAYSEAGVRLHKVDEPTGMTYVGLKMLSSRLHFPNSFALVYLVDDDLIPGFVIMIKNSDFDPAAEKQMRRYDDYSLKLSSVLGESLSILKKEKKPENRLENLLSGKNHYLTEWNYDNYKIALQMGNKEAPRAQRDFITIAVLYVPAYVK
jgi:hypothetical protein